MLFCLEGMGEFVIQIFLNYPSLAHIRPWAFRLKFKVLRGWADICECYFNIHMVEIEKVVS